MKQWIISVLLLASAFADAASRVGGGTLSNDFDFYEMKLAPAFTRFELLSADIVRLVGPTFAMFNLGAPQLIQVYRFVENSPIKGHERMGIDQFYLTNGWTRLSHLNNCIDVYRKETSSAVTYVAVWGREKGVVLAGPNTNLVSSSIEQMIQSLQLLPGACSWN